MCRWVTKLVEIVTGNDKLSLEGSVLGYPDAILHRLLGAKGNVSSAGCSCLWALPAEGNSCSEHNTAAVVTPVSVLFCYAGLYLFQIIGKKKSGKKSVWDRERHCYILWIWYGDLGLCCAPRGTQVVCDVLWELSASSYLAVSVRRSTTCQQVFLEKVTSSAAPKGGWTLPHPTWSLGMAVLRVGMPMMCYGHQHQALVSPVYEANRNCCFLESCPTAVPQKKNHPVILNITILGINLCWNEERDIHLINYEQQPDWKHNFLIVLGNSTACDDTLNVFATK